MKTLFLKNIAPFAVIAMGISGAFATTSMQNASSSVAPIGYTLGAQNKCNIEVSCSTNSTNPVCRQGITSGPQAFGKNAQGNCDVQLYRP
ncbi:hypothetical protein ACRASX_14995 [Flavobacterium sp. TMP13]|uniref:hypothetical protein n=1 Tax=Flavobacterium sp. TMP13 TaxID=3425950 RepID=UPI003D774939